MSILFVHERAAFTGGVEQNIADSVLALRARGIVCRLAYNPLMPAQPEFLRLFDASYPCSELSSVPPLVPTASLGELAIRAGARCVYLHKIPVVPASLFASKIRTVQMVHDHDLCCPRRHKYFALNNAICTRPMGWRCYLDGAFLLPDRKAPFGFRYESIEAKRREMQRRARLDLALVASQSMQQELSQNGYPPDRVQVLPLAVRDAVARSTSFASATPTVLYVGQLIRGKGVDLLLRALTLVKVPFRAVIVGRGNAEAALHKMCRDLHLDHSVEFTGWMDNEQLPRQYALADIVAVPSRWPEPFGMVGLEAMRHSKPVVAFNVGGRSRLVGRPRDWPARPCG